jgi:ABC-type nitrate/sulfonate/bicarbonate transport system substrate-binding protein
VDVDDWGDLAGLRIGVAPNSGPDIQFQLSAREAGFDPNSIERVNFTTLGPATLSALRNGEIDGMLCWEVVCAQAVQDGSGEYSSLDIGANETGNANTLALANADWIEEYPNAATRLVRAYVDAVDYFNEYPDELVALMTKETGAPAEVVEASLNSITLEWKLFRDRALATAQAYRELGVSEKDMSEVVEEDLDYTFLEAATGKSLQEVGG